MIGGLRRGVENISYTSIYRWMSGRDHIYEELNI